MSSYDKYYSNHESKSFIKVCNLCKTEIKYENSTKHTSNLRNHLKTKHSNVFEET